MVREVVVGRRYDSLMCSNPLGGPEAVVAALERLEADADAFGELSFDAVSEPDCVAVLERLMTVAGSTSAGQD
jgi:hypothetical protein